MLIKRIAEEVCKVYVNKSAGALRDARHNDGPTILSL
jgi:hypothetical protein